MVLALIVLAIPAFAPQQVATPVTDINTVPSYTGESLPGAAVQLGSVSIFAATHPTLGRELFVTSGLPGTTQMLDINPGSGWSSPYYLTVMGGYVYFAADDGVHGNELWRTDGTPGGTQLVMDIYPGASSSSPMGLAGIGNTLYFSAKTAAVGQEPWVSDGTAAGTSLLMDLHSPSHAYGTDSYASNFVPAGNMVFFSTVYAGGFFVTDGTPGGTISLAAGVYPTYVTALGNEVVFQGYGGTSIGNELWKSDGTPGGTFMYKEFQNGFGSGAPSYFVELGGELYFSAVDSASGGELWKTDGTLAGTVLLADINPGTASSSPQELALLGTEILFSAIGATTGRELFKTDGTTLGTVLVADIVPGATGSFSMLSRITATPTQVFFSAFDSLTFGSELWVSDGTIAGTVLVADIMPGTGSSSPLAVAPFGNQVMFSADDGVVGREPWISDGTPAGTFLVEDIDVEQFTNDAKPDFLSDIFGITYFAADDGVNGEEIWRTDGTSAGTFMLKDISVTSSHPDSFARLGNSLLFSALDYNYGRELWISDGTTAGTTRVLDIIPGLGSSSPYALTRMGDEVFFRASAGGGAQGGELWKTDGTAAGTMLVKDINPTGSSMPDGFVVFQDEIYFYATDGVSGIELWKSDGTSAGTVLVLDVNVGAGDSRPRDMAVFGDHLYFSAEDGVSGRELWRTDGTSVGTTLFADLQLGAMGSDPQHMTGIGPWLAFSADDGVNGRELWKTDGTALGTSMVIDLHPTSGGWPGLLTPLAGGLLFRARDTTTGYEMWWTDLTAAGTVQLADINPGSQSSVIYSEMPTVAGSRYAWFAADDGGTSYGKELWVTDGTPAGTYLYQDIYPGTADSDPSQIVLSNGHLLFRAQDVAFGNELFRLDLDATAQAIGVGNGGSGRVPTLMATDPILGQTMTLSGTDAMPGAPCVVYVGDATSSPLAMGGGHVRYLDPVGFLYTLATFTPATSDWSLNASVPATPSLAGRTYTAQAVFQPTSGPLGMDISNGVVLTLGD